MAGLGDQIGLDYSRAQTGGEGREASKVGKGILKKSFKEKSPFLKFLFPGPLALSF